MEYFINDYWGFFVNEKDYFIPVINLAIKKESCSLKLKVVVDYKVKAGNGEPFCTWSGTNQCFTVQWLQTVIH